MKFARVATYILAGAAILSFFGSVTAALIIYGLMAFGFIPYGGPPMAVWFFLSLSIYLGVLGFVANLFTVP